jgi:DNA mismatch endonuclease (patch repair protein)
MQVAGCGLPAVITMDIWSKDKRSEVMSRIRGTGNRDTELVLMALFRRHGITGWRRKQKLFGKPDFVFRKSWLAVFVDGCFWHGCPSHCTTPKSNRAFWAKKLASNKARDRRVTRTLKSKGWHVLRIWEHALVPGKAVKTIERIKRVLAGLPA